MDKLRVAVARAIEEVARSRPARSLRALRAPADASSQRGQGLAEYALILALIAVVAIVALLFLGSTITEVFEEVINAGFEYVMTVIGS